ncbi:cupin domain-containing protein [Streptomyces sp. NPDC004684]
MGAASIKVLRTDELPVAEEAHPTTEALLVLNGRLELQLTGWTMPLTANDICVVPANTPHAVLPGSAGALLIVDGDDEHDEGRAAAPQLTGRTED